MMEHRRIPASLHFEALHPNIDLEASPLRLAAEGRAWDGTAQGELRAGVSSFGIGGSNAHVVLAARPASSSRPESGAQGHPFVLSARTPRDLDALVDRWRSFLAERASTEEDSASWPSLRDACATLATGRTALGCRVASWVTSWQEVEGFLASRVSNQQSLGEARHRDSETAGQELLTRWLQGQDYDWQTLYPAGSFVRCSLPLYPFAGERFWLPQPTDGSATPARLTEVEPAPIAPSEVAAGELRAATLEWLRSSLAELLGYAPEEIDPSSSVIDDYDVDSVTNEEWVASLGRSLGGLPQTLLFEFPSLRELAEHLSQHHREALSELLGLAETQSAVPRSSPQAARETPRPAPTATASPSSPTAIAVIGLAGRFPGAPNIRRFWENLEAGRISTGEVPPERWDAAAFYDPSGEDEDKAYTRWGGFLEGADRFDPLFFNISRWQAELMDPQQRIFLENAWACFADAGYVRQNLPRRTGVFAGFTTNTYALAAMEESLRGNIQIPDTDAYDVANRVSYFFDLHGPSMAVDTACSSSLSAIHLAVQSLRRDECEMALAGGVNLTLHPRRVVQFCGKKMLLAGQDEQPYGDGPGGFVDSEGVASVLLKPLAAALADGDHIYGVVRGSAVNSGGRTGGYTVPDPAAQADLVRAALVDAGVDARTLSYVEGHGTGTKLGDPIEVEGLTRAFRDHTADTGFCALGSVKSNIGHLIAAAGVAGLAKLLLQLRHRTLVPSPHGERLNPRIDFARTPFVVQENCEAWQPAMPGVPRRAGISSFGAGGSNAHLIVEEAPEVAELDLPGPHLLVLSARDDDRLAARAADLVAALDAESSDERGPSMASVCYTLQAGREPMAARLACVVEGFEQAIALLSGWLESGAGVASEDGPVFSGHASQGPTGSEPALVHRGSGGREGLLALARIWAGGAEVDWSSLYPSGTPRRCSLPTYPFAGEPTWFPRSSDEAADQDLDAEGPAEEPLPQDSGAIVPASAFHPLIDHQTIINDGSAGGQYGVFIKALTREAFYLADHVIEGRCILPGVVFLEMVRAAAERLGIDRVELVDVVFSRPLELPEDNLATTDERLEPESHEEIAPELEDLAGRPAVDPRREARLILEPAEEGWTFQVVSGATQQILHVEGRLIAGEPAGDEPPQLVPAQRALEVSGERLAVDALYRRFRSQGLAYGTSFRPIQSGWTDDGRASTRLELHATVREQAEAYFLHPSLADGALQTALALVAGDDASDDLSLPFAIDRVRLIAPTGDACRAHAALLEPVAEAGGFWRCSVAILGAEGEVLAELSGCTFRRVPRQVSQQSPRQTASVSVRPASEIADLHCFRPALRALPDPKESATPAVGPQLLLHWPVAGPPGGLPRGSHYTVAGDSLARLGEAAYRIRPGSEEDMVALVGDLRSRGAPPASVVCFLGGPVAGPGADSTQGLAALERELDLGIRTLAPLCRELVKATAGAPVRFLIWGVSSSATAAALAAFCRTLHQEHSAFSFRVLETDETPSEHRVRTELADMAAGADHVSVAHDPVSREPVPRDGAELRRWLHGIEPCPPPIAEGEAASKLRRGGTYLITGGSGGLGLIVARLLLSSWEARVVLTGRSAEPGEALEALPFPQNMLYLSADVADPVAMRRVRDLARQRFGRIHGVFHCAGVIRDKLFYLKPPSDLEAVLRPKVHGFHVVDQVFRIEPETSVELMVLFSSITAVRGNPGQADYALANAYLDAKAAERTRSGSRVLSINWPLWQDGGMQLDAEELARWREHTGTRPLATDEGLGILLSALSGPQPQLIPACGELAAVTSALGAWQPLETSNHTIATSRDFPSEPTMTRSLPPPVDAASGDPPVGRRHAEAPAEASSEDLTAKTLSWLRSVVASALKLRENEVDDGASFMDYGVDSIVALRVIKRLEDELGELRKTLLFENANLSELVGCLVREQREALAEHLGVGLKPGVAPIEASSIATRAEPKDAAPVEPVRPVLGRWLGPWSELPDAERDHVRQLQAAPRSEFSVSLATRSIAPLIFLGRRRLAYFNVNHDARSLMVFGYTGPEDAYLELAAELAAHCEERGLGLNLLTERRLESVAGRQFTATPMGAMQRLDDLASFKLSGRSMRRLRYMVSRFAGLGDPVTVEYRPGSDGSTDRAIAGLIDDWCVLKDTVNPFVARVRSELLAGRLEPPYRLFVTWLDQRLQNAVLLARRAPDSWLMDLEFYGADMPLGGLEFAVVQILETLRAEGATAYSLGATYGPDLGPSPNADPAIVELFDDLRRRSDFGQGNFQFKNKFRPRNSCLYLCRPAGLDASTAIDVLVMISDPPGEPASSQPPASKTPAPLEAAPSKPRAEQRPAEGTEPSVPIPSVPTPGSIEVSKLAPASPEPPEPRAAEPANLLGRYGQNPLAVPADQVELDLMTDSWAELDQPFIDQRLRELDGRPGPNPDLEEALRGVFPFQHLIPVSSGRQAEALLTAAWPKSGRSRRIVLQNGLFPTWIF
ncbi:MAG: SDR family NAD(P)-dependent oxidoreductase, partial [Acidobacteriota bacterium]